MYENRTMDLETGTYSQNAQHSTLNAQLSRNTKAIWD